MNNITKLKYYQKFNNFPFHIEFFSPTELIERHQHDCVEMIFVTDGYANDYIDSFPFRRSRGNLVIISGQVSHVMFGFKDFAAYRVLFDMSLFNEFDENLQTSPGFVSLFVLNSLGIVDNDYCGAISMRGEYTDRLIPVFDELLSTYEKGEDGAQEQITALFYKAVELILEKYEKNNKDKGNDRYSKLAYDTIISNLNEPISISELARQLQVSRIYLYKAFVKNYGKSPAQFVMDMRVRNAKVLLTMTDKSITEIAISCGFENPGYFAKIFKSWEGMSPSEYRKTHKK
ncbi:MAG: helix-turn-helix domain-containing protein [Clostridia bacterium]|nr:helix-turn-helix domain-containing protein [Clostridia bacterium]MBR2973177.1 helix-turn-helix domain-containing protein [Clostridia bacterium]MBR3576624.1 helix-turn-helix domain-containing protein [Clostridia bacterium]